jgi:hypothetical protein
MGHMAGCMLGVPVEFWPISRMEILAQESGMPFPPFELLELYPRPL